MSVTRYCSLNGLRSTNTDHHSTSRALSALYEKEVGFELVPVNLSVGEQKQPEFLAKNVSEIESRAINHYVAHKYKDQGTDLIRHKNVKEAGLVGVWVEVESQTFNPAISPIIYQLYVKPLHGETADHYSSLIIYLNY
ncbi:hypothetical protein Syun_028845 [Stephania yunnanensis]|uniref:glutathione transferase n=1 Tax=Stephania yunnanensis TaxID=152371 RepID=A0AAP0E4J8_9MAGN